MVSPGPVLLLWTLTFPLFFCCILLSLLNLPWVCGATSPAWDLIVSPGPELALSLCCSLSCLSISSFVSLGPELTLPSRAPFPATVSLCLSCSQTYSKLVKLPLLLQCLSWPWAYKFLKLKSLHQYLDFYCLSWTYSEFVKLLLELTLSL
jgi:hypothetical protein